MRSLSIRADRRFSLRSFLIYFCCVTIPLLFFSLYAVKGQLDLANENYVDGITIRAERITALMDSQFSALQQTANEIYYSSWYTRFISSSDLYRSELNIVKKLETTGDLSYKCTMLPLAGDILVYSARTGEVVCRYGWFADLQKYCDVYCPLRILTDDAAIMDQELTRAAVSLDESQLALSYPDPNGNHGCRVLVLLRRGEVEKYIAAISDGSDLALTLVKDGEPLWEKETAEGERDELSCAVARSGLTLRFTYPAYNALYGGRNLMLVLGFAAAALAIGFLIAQALTVSQAGPVARLLRQMPESSASSHKEAYRDISRHISTITEQNLSLTQQLHDVTTSLRSEWLLRCMIDGTTEMDRDTMVHLFPWLEERRPYCFVLFQDSPEAQAAWQSITAGLLPEQAQCLDLALPLHHCGKILWTKERAVCDGLVSQLRQGGAEQAIQLAVAGTYAGVESLTACYADATAQAGAWHDKLPLAEVCELLGGVQSGQYAACLHALELLRAQGDEQSLHQFYAILFGADEAAQIPPEEESWEDIEQRVRQRCSTEDAEQETPSMLEAINSYLQTCYALPDMSLKYLAGELHTTVNNISRLYKRGTGENFSDALQSLRMEHAREMLTGTTENIATIAAACGYANYLSFKRAFIRVEGISPREYRDVHSQPQSGEKQ